MPNLIICIILVTLITCGCSTPNPEAPPPGQVHAIIFSNPESTAFHGMDVNALGTDGCLSCHGNDLSGTDSIPGCYDCHFDPLGSPVPPNSGWTHGQAGHLNYVAYQNVCNNCHDTLRRFELQPEFCHDCHGEGLNHVLGQAWLDKNSPDFHGRTGLVDCSNCHDLSQKCFQCHFGQNGSKSPPGSGWTHGDNNEHRDYESYQNTCNLCHDLNRSYGNEPPSCHDCHED